MYPTGMLAFYAASLLTKRFIIIGLSACQDRIDHGFELIERGRADHLPAVNDERGGSDETIAARLRHALIHLGIILSRIETLIELCCIQSKLGGIGFQVINTQGRRFGIQQIVIFPELALIEGTLPRFRRLGGLSGDDGIISPYKMHLVAVGRDDLFQDTGLLPAAAGGTAKITIFDDGHLCRGKPQRRVGCKTRGAQGRGLRRLSSQNQGRHSDNTASTPTPMIQRRVDFG